MNKRRCKHETLGKYTLKVMLAGIDWFGYDVCFYSRKTARSLGLVRCLQPDGCVSNPYHGSKQVFFNQHELCHILLPVYICITNSFV